VYESKLKTEFGKGHSVSQIGAFRICYVLNNLCSIPDWGREFSFRHRVKTGSGAYSVYYPMGIGGCYPGGETDHSPPSNAEVKNAWSYTSNPPYVFMAWCRRKQKIQIISIPGFNSLLIAHFRIQMVL